MATPGLYIDTNTLQVGIGTTRPKETFHVQGNLLSTGNITSQGTVTASNLSILGDFVTLNTITSNTEQMVIQNAGTGPALKVTQTGANSIAEFYDDGNALALKIADGGNVGIGTANPQEKLHVYGNITIMAPDDTPILRFDRPGGSYDWEIYSVSGGSLRFRGGADGSKDQLQDKVTFASDGKVGVGTTQPQATLDVSGNTSSLLYFIRNKQIQRVLVGYLFAENSSSYAFTDAVNVYKNTFSSSYTRVHNNSTIEVVLKPSIAFAMGANGTVSYGQVTVRIEFTYPNGTKEYSGTTNMWLRIDNSFYEIEMLKKLVYTLSSANSALLTSGASISALVQLVKTAQTGTVGSFGLHIWGGKSSIKFKEFI